MPFGSAPPTRRRALPPDVRGFILDGGTALLDLVALAEKGDSEAPGHWSRQCETWHSRASRLEECAIKRPVRDVNRLRSPCERALLRSAKGP